MNPRRQRIEELFEAASELGSAADRAEFLQRECAGDPGLQAEVEDLLKAAEAAESIFEPHEAAGARFHLADQGPLVEGPGVVIGRYKLLQQIGEGGMGVVYMAEQQEPVRRKVALKVIKLGMDTKQVIARFEAERQALALMDHPNIAKVLDGGATETGRPFFVMDLVQGVPITEFCEKNHLAVTERLQLFISVCQAIQSAHQKGIIHRDIKPTNILVTLNPDGTGHPMVIDFGVAKAVNQKLTEKTLFTNFATMIGSPAYMSPEQAEMSRLDMDTRADIYSLGVLLYELLTGVTPFDGKELIESGLDEMRRTIQTRVPARPSTRVRRLSAAAAGGVKAPAPRPVSADLDWIVMKCLEKDRTRRYETANGLARDIERHLNNEPVAARPPSRWYEFQRSVQRHKFGYAAAAVTLVSLVAGLAASLWAAAQARHAGANESKARLQAVRSAASEAQARALAEQRLCDARLAVARAKRLGELAGRRFDSLAAIADAAALRPSPELRDEATACLALSDVRVAKTFTLPSRASAEQARFDPRLRLYAYEKTGGISIRSTANNEERFFLSLPGANPESCALVNLRLHPEGRFFSAQVVRGDKRGHVLVWDLAHGGIQVLDVVGGSEEFSSNGRELMIATGERTVSLFDLASLKEVKRFDVGVPVHGLAFNPDGTRVAVFGDGGSVSQVWDLETSQLEMSLVSDEGISALAWSGDGSLVAMGRFDGKISLWDARRGECVRQLEAHHGRVVGLGFAHHGGCLASRSWDGTMRLWDVATGRPLVVYRGAFGNLVFSEDDRLLAGACETSRCQLFEVAWPTGYRRLPPRLTHAQALDLDFTADWRLAAVAGSGHVRLVDVLAGDDLGLVGATLFRSVRFGPPDRTAVWAAGEGGFYRWRLRPSTHAGLTLLRPEPQERLLVQGTVAKFDFDLGEQRLAATALGRGIWLSALNHPAEAPRLFSRPAVVFVAMDPAGRWAASGTWKGKGVQVLDFSTGHLLASLPIPGSANVAASPNGEWLATSNEAETRLWTTATWSVAPQALAGDPTFQAGIMAFSPDSRLLAVCHDSSEIRLVRVPGLEPVARFFLPCEGNIVTLRFSPDGQTLAALETTGDIHLWDLRVVRSELRNLGLDWNYPAFEGPASPAAAAPTAIALDVGPFGRDELARRIPPRNPNTPPHLPDLSAYYNAPLTANWQGDHKGRDDLAKWPCGITNLGGVAFDVRGLIQIGTAGPGGTSYPDRVEAVSVGQVAARLHFLHAAVDAAAARSGDTLGHYVIRYVDGRRADIPIVFGKDLADWRSPPGDAALTATPAWTGAYPAAAGSSRNVSLFKTSWDNPHPGVPIRQLDFIAEKGAMGAPFLVALTLDPPTATGAGGPQPAGP